MPLYLTEDQTILQDTIRDFVAGNAPVSHLRALRDADDPTGFSRDLWRQFAGMGFPGMMVDEAHGGLGLGHVEAGIVLEEIGRNLSPSPFLSTAVAAVAALGVDERSKHGGPIACRAERDGNGFRMSGAKCFVAHGHVADLLLVAARTAGAPPDADGLTVFALPRDQVVTEAQRLADASITARVTFANIRLDSDAVVGDVDGGRAVLDRLLGAARTGASAELLGVGTAAMDRTLGYLRERRQFGVPVGSFQALQHRAAHLYAEMEVARAAVLKAQQLLDAGSPEADAAVSVAKAMTGLATTLAVQEGVQMHGGIGMTDEYDIGLYMKRARVLAEMFGDTNHHADRLATAAGY